MYVQNFLQPSFIGPLDVVGPRHLRMLLKPESGVLSELCCVTLCWAAHFVC